MKVREIMSSDPRTAQPDTTLEEIATMMKEEDVGSIPVIDDGRVTGVVTDRDIVIRCIAEGRDATESTAEEVMSTGLKTVDPESDVDDAAEIMAEAQVRRLPVVKNGKLVGMLALGDIAVKAGEEEEETTAETLEEVSEGVKGKRGQLAGSDSDADAEDIDVDEENELEMAGSGARRGQQNSRGQQQGSRGQNSAGRQQQSGRQQSGRNQQSGGNQQSGRSQQNGRNQQSGGSRQSGGSNQQSGRGQQNARGNQEGSRGSQQKKGAQGISNRSASRENERQAKVAPKRAEAGGRRNASTKRRAG